MKKIKNYFEARRQNTIGREVARQMPDALKAMIPTLQAMHIVDFDEIADRIPLSDLASYIDTDDLKADVSAYDVAREMDVYDVAMNLDSYDIAYEMVDDVVSNIDKQELARKVGHDIELDRKSVV